LSPFYRCRVGLSTAPSNRAPEQSRTEALGGPAVSPRLPLSPARIPRPGGPIVIGRPRFDRAHHRTDPDRPRSRRSAGARDRRRRGEPAPLRGAGRRSRRRGGRVDDAARVLLRPAWPSTTGCAVLPEDGPALGLLRRLAVRHAATVGGSFPCRDADGHNRNAYLLMGPDGRRGAATTRTCPRCGRTASALGRRRRRKDIRTGVRVGAAVCWELMRTQAARRPQARRRAGRGLGVVEHPAVATHLDALRPRRRRARGRPAARRRGGHSTGACSPRCSLSVPHARFWRPANCARNAKRPVFAGLPDDGACRSRTGDLLLAKQALYQLS
jgi:hypothetical protein